uniref:LysM domain-containing protein n=2 Tax=Tetraselmis chuii TaxID=63592 RepID=A0A7S1SVU3_9CHLO
MVSSADSTPTTATPAARLQVSVIEARNVQADMSNAPDFYVKLKMSGREFQTDVVKGSTTPKFLKDIRLDVLNLETDTLRMEMLQVGPKGDLILGTDKVSLKPMSETGTLVQWFNLKDAAGALAAELCLVLRYSSGEKTPSRRSKSPSPRVNPKASPSGLEKGKTKSKKKKAKKGMLLPLPLAVAGGLLAGAFAFLWAKKPEYYEVKEGDTLCRIGICFNRPHQELYSLNSKVIADPNVIYPGDRIRVL